MDFPYIYFVLIVRKFLPGESLTLRGMTEFKLTLHFRYSSLINVLGIPSYMNVKQGKSVIPLFFEDTLINNYTD